MTGLSSFTVADPGVQEARGPYFGQAEKGVARAEGYAIWPGAPPPFPNCPPIKKKRYYLNSERIIRIIWSVFVNLCVYLGHYKRVLLKIKEKKLREWI